MMPKQATQIERRFLSFRYIGKLPFLAKKLFFKRFAYLLIFGVLLFILLASYQNQNGSRFAVKYEISVPRNGDGAVVQQKLETHVQDNGQEVANVKQDIKDRLGNGVPQNDEIQQVVQSLEEPITETDYSEIFKGDLSDNTTWELDFSGISKRRFGRNYQEITSADPEGRNADFFNPIMVSGRSMIIFEDYGPGILERVLLHCRKLDLENSIRYVIIENFDNYWEQDTATSITSRSMVDGKRMFMQDKNEKDPEKTYPFREPLFRASKLTKDTGYLITFPIAYKESIRVMNAFSNGPEYDDFHAWNSTFHCKKDKYLCPIACYFDVTYNKFVHGTKLKNTFGDYFSPNNPQTKFLKEVTNAVSEMVNSPEDYGPGLKTGCQLTCRRVASGEEIVIYSAENAAQVIQSILFRLYDVKSKAVTSKNWKTMLITMTWDGKEPQVKEIPLAGIFTNGFDYLREVRSLNAGVKMKTCSSHGHRANEMKARDWLAFLFYDMPFWKSAKVTIKRLPGLLNGIICTQFTTKPLDMNQYNPRLTGYFSAQLQQQIFWITHNKIMLKLENEWGHVVALNFFLRNTLVAYTQENDVIIEIDQANVPTISGTGMEDYFNYIHGFQGVANSSSAFNGVPFFRKVTRLRWIRCYRHMTLDPILFTNGILIYLEGYWDRIARRVYRKFRETSSNFNQTSEPDSLLSVVLYYGSKGNGGQTTDILHYKDFKNSSNFDFSPPDVETFAVTSFFENQPYIPFNRIVLSMKPEQTVTHVFKISKNNVGVILRREYRTMVPNQKAHVMVDGEEAGLWFCPQRALSEQYSLRLHDYHLPPRNTVGKETIKVTLKAVTEWETVSIKVVSVVLTE